MDAHPESTHQEKDSATGTAPQDHWMSLEAGRIWSSVKGAALVAGEVGKGAFAQVTEHPLATAAEIASGVVTAGIMARKGIGLAAGAAMATVPLAGYGLYRGGQIAATEGIGSIPAHLKSAYRETRNEIGVTIQAAETVYRGDAQANFYGAGKRLQTLGRESIPIAAGLLGGGSLTLGKETIQITARASNRAARALKDALLPPTYELAPALAYDLPAQLIQVAGRSAETKTASSLTSVSLNEIAGGSLAPPQRPTWKQQGSKPDEIQDGIPDEKPGGKPYHLPGAPEAIADSASGGHLKIDLAAAKQYRTEINAREVLELANADGNNLVRNTFADGSFSLEAKDSQGLAFKLKIKGLYTDLDNAGAAQASKIVKRGNSIVLEKTDGVFHGFGSKTSSTKVELTRSDRGNSIVLKSIDEDPLTGRPRPLFGKEDPVIEIRLKHADSDPAGKIKSWSKLYAPQAPGSFCPRAHGLSGLFKANDVETGIARIIWDENKGYTLYSGYSHIPPVRYRESSARYLKATTRDQARNSAVMSFDLSDPAVSATLNQSH